MNDIPARLAAAGIDLPRPGPLPLAEGVTAAGFPSAGDEALDWWRRLRAVHDTTGLWPVLIPSLDDAVCPSGRFGPDPAGRVAVALTRDGAALLNRGRPLAEEPERVREELLEQWPEDPYRIDRFYLPYEWDGQPRQVLVALIEAQHGWQVPPLLDYGYWNDCPEPAVHGAVLRHWGERWGAELVCMARDGIELALTRPPRTRETALELAWEYPVYCLDGMSLYYADSVSDLAACLIDANLVRFWWD